MSQRKERTGIEVASERAVLAAVRLPHSNFDHRDPFGELNALAQQAGAVVVGEMAQTLDRPVAGTFMGSGKVKELAALCDELAATTIIFDNDLSPKQISAIEEVTKRKVIDRSELILDIFASRATTAEAQLQVELAQLEYTYPRIRGMWTHLERIVGSGGAGGSRGIGTRGPGEQQLEIDRRLVQRRQNDLRERLREIQARKRREVFERKREHFTVGLVGYTNAGKSTLFNTMTSGGAYADDRLFATLITRTRQIELGGGCAAMLSDTVGFVRDLPHNLIASFKATLEEATHADLLLIVLDVSDPAAELHYKTVTDTLDELCKEVATSGYEEDRHWTPPERLLLLNKVDRLEDNRDLLVWQQKVPQSLPICALPPSKSQIAKGESNLGQATLLNRIRELVLGQVEELDVTLPLRDARTISLIESQGKVLDRSYSTDAVTLRVKMGRKQIDRMRGTGIRMTLRTANGVLIPGPDAPRNAWGSHE
ncbi:MAG: GTPase HflX [Planctomycetes bacterium]|nr:GTPase HflX [Planctomycetota bacterium]